MTVNSALYDGIFAIFLHYMTVISALYDGHKNVNLPAYYMTVGCVKDAYFYEKRIHSSVFAHYMTVGKTKF